VSTDVGIWLGALCTLAVLSYYLIRESIVYRLAEHLFVGMGAAHAIVLGWGTVRDLALNPLVKGKFIVLIPLCLGIALYARPIRKIPKWITNLPIALLVGIGAGISIRGIIGSQVISQVRATMLPLNTVNNWVILLSVLSTITFFVFSLAPSPKSPLGAAYNGLSRLGRGVLMVTFGAAFANAAIMRFTLLAGRLQFLIHSWILTK